VCMLVWRERPLQSAVQVSSRVTNALPCSAARSVVERARQMRSVVFFWQHESGRTSSPVQLVPKAH
jgi:hypothetical protein